MNRLLPFGLCGITVAILSGCATAPQQSPPEAATVIRMDSPQDSGNAPQQVPIAEPEGVLNLTEVLALALERSPELATYNYDIRIAEAEILQASLRPNPEIQAQSENFGGSGAYRGMKSSENTLQIGQLIELSSKRQKRIDEARFGREVATLEYESRKRDVFLATHTGFTSVLVAQRAVAVNEELVKLAEQGLPDIQRRIEAGKTSPLEAQRANVSIANTRIALEQTKRELQAARYRLASQWGSTQPKFTTVQGNLENLVSLEPLETLTAKLANNPRLTRFGAEKMQREARLRLEKAKAVPDVTVFGGAREFGTADDTALIVGASIPLPFFNRNQGAIRAARERLSKSDSEKAAVQIELSTLLAEAYQIAQGATAQINLFRNSVLPQSEQALSTAREGYTAGRFSFLDVLDAQRTVIAARQQYIQALATYQQSAARVISLTVGAPSEPLSTR